MSYFFFILVFILCVTPLKSVCKFGSLDLTQLAVLNDPIQCSYDNGEKTWMILAKLCGNTLECEKTGDYGMVIQSKAGSDECGQPLAYWDNGQTKPLNSPNKWTFEYTNGFHEGSQGCFAGRNLSLSLICDSSDAADPYEVSKTYCSEGETVDGYCPYYFTIYTKYACVGMGFESNSISGGSVFLIIIFSGFMLYFIVGYLIAYYKHKNIKDFKNNIPNYSFWVILPSLVKVGCQVTLTWIMSITGKHAAQQTND